MLLSVYTPPPPPPKKGVKPLFIVLGVCGGGCLLVILAIVAFGIFSFSKFKEVDKLAGGFLADVREHKYAEARARLSPDGQASLSESDLKAQEEQSEANIGSLKSWQISNQSSTPGSQTVHFTYILMYDRGTSTCDFTFTANQKAEFSLVSVHLEPSGGSSGRSR